MTTITLIDDDGDAVQRRSFGDIDTWMNLTEIFFEALYGLGYSLPASPVQMREILEDFHDKAMAIKYPKEQPKEVTTDQRARLCRHQIETSMQKGERISLKTYDGCRHEGKIDSFEPSYIVLAGDMAIYYRDVFSWKPL